MDLTTFSDDMNWQSSAILMLCQIKNVIMLRANDKKMLSFYQREQIDRRQRKKKIHNSIYKLIGRKKPMMREREREKLFIFGRNSNRGQ